MSDEKPTFTAGVDPYSESAIFILVVDGKMARDIKSYLLVNLIYKRGTVLKTFRGLQSYQYFVC